MSTDKRARQKANRASRVAAAEADASRARNRSRLITYGALAAVVVLAIIAVSVLSSDDDADCPAEDGSSPRITSFAAAPPMCIDETATYTATVDTNFGEFTIELDAALAPATVNNFVVLARYGFYDGVAFHRIIPGFVIQGGDAVGNPPGTGNPGYTIADELPQEGGYTIGSVAMANSGPNTNGSQFFVITGDQGVALPPLYSLFGSVSAGLDVVLDIESTETTATDSPVEPIIINSVTIIQS